MPTLLKTLKAGLIGFIAALIINLVLVYLTKPLAPDFRTLSNGPVIFWTVLGTLGAMVTFFLTKYGKNPGKLFKKIAWVVLILSFIPDISLLIFTIPGFSGVTVGGVIVLMVLHVVVFASLTYSLLKWGRRAVTV